MGRSAAPAIDDDTKSKCARANKKAKDAAKLAAKLAAAPAGKGKGGGKGNSDRLLFSQYGGRVH